MNREPPLDPLDRLLQMWADERTPDESRLEILRRRIGEALDEPAGTETDRLPAQVDVRPSAASRTWRPWVWFAAGGTVALTLALSMWIVAGGRLERPSAAIEPLPPDFAWLRNDQLRNKAQLLNEMDDVFEGRVRWVAETDRRVELGLADESGPPDAEDPLAMRLIVQRRDAGEDGWTVVWSLDVVSHSEQVIRLASKDTGGAELRLWAYRLPDGMILLESDMAWPSMSALHLTAAELLQQGRPAEVFSSEIDGTEYRVWQTAATLAKELG